MKKNLLICLVLILMAGLTIAAGGKGVQFEGVITAIDTDAKTITVNSLVVKVTDDTLIYLALNPHEVGDFDDLEVGLLVRVVGVLHGDVIVAKKIIVHY